MNKTEIMSKIKKADGSQPINLGSVSQNVIAELCPGMDSERIKNYKGLSLRKELFTRARGKFYLSRLHPNRASDQAWVKILKKAMASGDFTPCLVHVIVDKDGYVITGEHTIRALLNYLDKYDVENVPILVLADVPHDEIAHAEGTGRKQNLADVIYRVGKITDRQNKPMNVNAFSGFLRTGVRTASHGAHFPIRPAAKFVRTNLTNIIAITESFRGSIKWIRRAPVMGAFVRVQPHVRPVDLLGAAQVLAGHPKVNGQQFAVFEALQNHIVQMQGSDISAAETQYFYGTLHAWAIFLGRMKGTLIKDKSLKVLSAPDLAAALREHKPGKPVTVGNTQLMLPDLDYADADVQQGLLDQFSWTAKQLCGLTVR